MRRTLAALLIATLLSACSGSSEALDQLNAAAPANDPYASALVKGYKGFARDKLAEGDSTTADYFASKGLAISRGEAGEPESLGQWKLPPSSIRGLSAAAEKLDAAIEVNQATQPALTAAAVVAYDRYVEAVANSPSPEAIDAAEVSFESALKNLGQVQVAQPGTHAPASEPGARAAGKPLTILYFPFDRDQLGASAKKALNKLAVTIKAKTDRSIAINGHTDRAGTEAYNQDLSERRAKFVEKALRTRGVPTKQLHYFAFGESDPAVATDDDAREPKNRRVEIVVE